MGALIVMSALLIGCAPPPLPEASLPAVSFLFPESRDDVVYCPDMVIVVGISDYEIGAPDDDDTLGHWHLRDDSGAFLLAAMEPWVSFTFGPDEDFREPRLTSISAALASSDHTELNTAVYPDASASAEFFLGATVDCVGGMIPDTSDSGLLAE